MLPFKNILVPIDYSAPCDAVIPYASAMMHSFHAQLSLVHAYGIADTLDLCKGPITYEELEQKARERQECRLKEYARRMFPADHVETFARLSEPASAIENVLDHQGADLVMLATHGDGPIRRMLMGSVVTKVLHDAGAAVWTGTGSALSEHSPQLPYKTILCALDHSPEAAAVLTAASFLARHDHAKLHLIHAVDVQPSYEELGDLTIQKALLDAADVKLRELKGTLGVDAPHTVRQGWAPDEIRNEAVRMGADLIVTGRGRAQATFNRILSRLYPIIRAAPCPVLSI